jgi:signal transduction histidine kinase
VYDLLDEAIQRTRSLTSEISPPVLYELGLVPALRWLCDRMDEEHGIQCDVEDDAQPKPVNDDLRLVLFQGVRELLLNVWKHARAGRCTTTVRQCDDYIVITVSDDGIGFDAQTVRRGAGEGFGLFNIRERLSHLGGSLEISAPPGAGTAVTMSAPLQCCRAIEDNE